MQSLGRVGRILSGSLDPAAISVRSESQNAQRDTPVSEEAPQASGSGSSRVDSPSKMSSSDEAKKQEDSQSQCSNYSGIMMSKTSTILQEPDVIASTKLAHSKTTDSVRQKCKFEFITKIVTHHVSLTNNSCITCSILDHIIRLRRSCCTAETKATQSKSKSVCIVRLSNL